MKRWKLVMVTVAGDRLTVRYCWTRAGAMMFKWFAEAGDLPRDITYEVEHR